MDSLELKLTELEPGQVTKRRKKDLTPEERTTIRIRLLAGQQKAAEQLGSLLPSGVISDSKRKNRK